MYWEFCLSVLDFFFINIGLLFHYIGFFLNIFHFLLNLQNIGPFQIEEEVCT